MKNIKLKTVILIILLAMFSSSCIFTADRSNPNDPKSGASDYQIFVSSDRGSDSNDGSRYSPIQSLQRALEISPAGVNIAVEAGTYEANELALAGVSIYGGFAADTDFVEAQRDPANNITTINSSGAQGGDTTYPDAIITIDGDENNQTVVDGFHINGSTSGSYLAAVKIYCDNGNSFDAVIRNNVITGGTATQMSTGIVLVSNENTPNSTITVYIDSNTINPATVSSAMGDIDSQGIRLVGKFPSSEQIDVKIWNNVIDAGAATSSMNVTARETGIYTEGISPDIYNNTIVATFDPTTSSGTEEIMLINMAGEASPRIINNIFSIAGRTTINTWAIHEDSNLNVQMIRRNCFHAFDGGTEYYYYDMDSVKNYGYLDIQGRIWDGTSIVLNDEFIGNNDGIPLFEVGTWILTTGSDDGIINGGEVLPDFNYDRSGNERTDPWSMGAYEYD